VIPASPIDAAELIAALRPHLSSLGITRVGDLTGLDTIGIPVAFASRPNSRSLSVTQGKSLCLDEASLGAIMESVEQAFAERAERLIVCRSTTRELIARSEAFVDPRRFLRVAMAPKDDDRVAWTRATSLTSGESTLLPFELVGLDMRADAGWDFAATPVTSIGLAAAPSWAQAATHALQEVIEHNATAVIDLLGFLPAFARPVRYRFGSDNALDEILSRVAHAGLNYALFDIASPGGLPVIAALLDCPDLVPGWIQFAGFACRFSPERAAAAALLEAVQSRLTLIAGARDDLKASSYRGNAKQIKLEREAGIPLDELPHRHARFCQAPAKDQLHCAVDAVKALGATDVFAATLGGIEGLVSVVRIVACGMEASGFNATTLLGQRSLNALFSAAEADV
jgi:ribosomal protein S12 methylthiotransferase accessory factor